MTSNQKLKARRGETILCRSARLAPALVVAAVGTLAAGCASTPPAPLDFDPSHARIVPMTAAPAFDVSGLRGGKAMGAGVGAGTGTGLGALTGGLLCLGTGPFFPLCMGTVLPLTTSVGAVTGAVVGGARTEAVEALELKTRVLGDEFAAIAYHEQLAQQLDRQMRSDSSANTTLAGPIPTLGTVAPDLAWTSDRPWTVEVGVTEVGTEGKGEYALRLTTTVRLRRAGSAPVWASARQVRSETELTTEQWTANDSAALHGVLNRCIELAARQLATDLVLPVPDKRASPPRAVSSSSCQDVPGQWLQASAPS